MSLGSACKRSPYRRRAIERCRFKPLVCSCDALGRRASVTVTGQTTYFVYDGPHVIADVNASGSVIRSYVYGPGIDNILAMTTYGSTTQTYFYLKDQIGSTLALVDASGAVIERYDYDAWGRVTVYDHAHRELTASAVGNRYTFQGREYSWQTRLLYFRSRWYDSITGRWLSRDTIGIAGGLNLYAFCGNNPVNCVDPFGLEIRPPNQSEQAVIDSIVQSLTASQNSALRDVGVGLLGTDIQIDTDVDRRNRWGETFPHLHPNVMWLDESVFTEPTGYLKSLRDQSHTVKIFPLRVLTHEFEHLRADRFVLYDTFMWDGIHEYSRGWEDYVIDAHGRESGWQNKDSK